MNKESIKQDPTIENPIEYQQEHDKESIKDKEPSSTLDEVYQRLEIETKIKLGAENMLQVFDTFQRGDLESKRNIELQLNAANHNIAALTREVQYYKNLKSEKEDAKDKDKDKDKDKEKAKDKYKDLDRDNDIKTNTDKGIETTANFSTSLPKVEKIESTSESNEFEGQDPIQVLNQLIFQPSDKNLSTLCLLVKKYTNYIISFQPDLSKVERKILINLRKNLLEENLELRALTMKAIRQTIELTNNGFLFNELHLDIFTVRALTLELKWDAEREQSLVLIRTLMSLNPSGTFINDAIIRAIIAVAEVNNDKHRSQCLGILAELLVVKPEDVTRVGGLRVLINSLLEINFEMARAIVQLLMALIDRPSTRKFIRPGADFEVLFSVFSDSYDKSGIQREKLKIGSRLVLEILRSWNGIMYLCIENKRAIKSIVNALISNSLETRKIMLEMFYLLLDLNLPLWSVNINSIDTEDYQCPKLSHTYDKNLNLVYQHYAAVLHILFEANIVERLTKLIESDNQHVAFYSTILLSEMTKLSSCLMSKASKSVQALPKLFESSVKFHSENLRYTALEAINKVDNSNLSFLRSSGLEIKQGTNSKGQRQAENVKLQLGVQVDENHFKSMVIDTQVLIDKDYQKWNWGVIMELIQGPLWNTKRLDDVIKNTKLIKRLLNFYTPKSSMFSEIKSKKDTYIYIQVGCELMRLLAASQEGYKTLIESDFLLQISEALQELDPINTSHSPDNTFSKEKMIDSLTPYYFTLLGTLSKYKLGISALEKFHIFDLFYHVTELRSRDDLVKAIVNHLDYRREGHARIILSKVLTSAYKHIRLFATNFLRALHRRNITNFSTWGIHLLITQLYDPSMEVCEMAVSVLDEACMRPENLRTLVRLNPSVSHIPFAGDSLFLRYLSSTDGLDYLLSIDYVDHQMDTWFKERNRHYITRIELSLSRALEKKYNSSRGSYWFDQKHEPITEDPEKLEKFDGMIFPHFYGELCKTFKGCEILLSKGHLAKFSNYLKKHKYETFDSDIILNLKACLWALGHIGSSDVGITILAQADAVEDIIWVAEKSEVYSLRGTAVFVLGLIGSSQLGDEVLQEAKWVSIFTGFESKSPWATRQSWDNVPEWKYNTTVQSFQLRLNLVDQIEKDILITIGNLSNHILIHPASLALMRLKNTYPQYFKRPELFFLAFKILENYHFRLTARQFIWNLFQIPNVPTIFESFTQIQNKHSTISFLDAEPSKPENSIHGSNEVEHPEDENETRSFMEELIEMEFLDSEKDNKAMEIKNIIDGVPKKRIIGFQS